MWPPRALPLENVLEQSLHLYRSIRERTFFVYSDTFGAESFGSRTGLLALGLVVVKRGMLLHL